MKSIIIAVLMFGAVAVHAQTPAPSLNLFQIGRNFGASGQYQFGIDKTSLVGGCVERELGDGQWLAGPCRNILVLSKNGIEVAHISGSVMYNAEHGNASYGLGLGYRFGPVVKAAAEKVASDIPEIDKIAEDLEGIQLPPALNQLSDMTDIDFVGGFRPVHTPDVNGNITYGVMARLTLSVAQAEALLPTPVGTPSKL